MIVKYISTILLQVLVWHLISYCLLTCLCLLVFHAYGTLFHRFFLCLYSLLFSILTHMIKASSSLYSCVYCATAVEFISAIEKELLISCPSCQSPQSLQIDFLLASSVCLTLCSHSSYLCGQPCIIYDLSFHRWAFWCVVTCMCSMDVHTGIFTHVLMVLTFMFMPVIS